ncbi:hypothetical protein ERJ75_001189000 [Trypanosoma vivax]|uniref:Uncharacterized protein n=1 Tax=Trypanosoma vivax (strain Y486) TaxID=1055687 RepID=G0UC88_TRYVY|nr:hypothetical protein TRVL_01171 [Trypanosoma vivax]KAH8609468.1 hypothetical protein ERJ75_001189000 [Trypanosoma vivax]CCC53438.1 conserved hypothetical protein [Trypanosoma vivax Y486]
MLSFTRQRLTISTKLFSFSLNEHIFSSTSFLWASISLKRESLRHEWGLKLYKYSAGIYLKPLPDEAVSNSAHARELLSESSKSSMAARVISINGIPAESIQLMRKEMSRSSILVLNVGFQTQPTNTVQQARGKASKPKSITSGGDSEGAKKEEKKTEEAPSSTGVDEAKAAQTPKPPEGDGTNGPSKSLPQPKPASEQQGQKETSLTVPPAGAPRRGRPPKNKAPVPEANNAPASNAGKTQKSDAVSEEWMTPQDYIAL